MQIRRALPIVAVAALTVGFASAAIGAPKKNTPNPTKPQPKPSAPAKDFEVVDGFISSMSINAAGEIVEFSMKEVGKTSSAPVYRVRGCGIKQADHPVLLMAFERYQRVWVNVRPSDECYLGTLVSSPNKP